MESASPRTGPVVSRGRDSEAPVRQVVPADSFSNRQGWRTRRVATGAFGPSRWRWRRA